MDSPPFCEMCNCLYCSSGSKTKTFFWYGLHLKFIENALKSASNATTFGRSLFFSFNLIKFKQKYSQVSRKFNKTWGKFNLIIFILTLNQNAIISAGFVKLVRKRFSVSSLPSLQNPAYVPAWNCNLCIVNSFPLRPLKEKKYEHVIANKME